MYDRQLTARRVVEVSQQQGWQLKYSTPAQVDHAIAHFHNLWDADAGRLTRALSTPEQRFIQNERKLCALDFHYWLANYSWIVGLDKTPTKLIPNVAQRIILDLWAEDEAAGHAIWMQQLKARRLGVSTLSELNVCHRFQFHPYSSCLIASADPGKTIDMAGMIRFCLEQQPWWLLPTATKIKHSMPVEFAEMHSTLSIESGNQFTGVGRGGSPNIVHLCVAPNTLIRVANGFLKPITEIAPGESVITHTGVVAPVRAVWQSPRRNELGRDLWVWGSFAPLSTTRDHRVRTATGWTEAKDLTTGDWVVHPVRPITQQIRSLTYTRASAGRPAYQKHREITETLSRDWGWLLGLYLAEGTIQPNKKLAPEKQACAVLFSGDVNEVELRQERLGRVLGAQHIGVRRANSRTRVLYVGNAGLARWVASNFGQTDSKRIPDWVWEAGRDFCLGIVEGYLHGDGHYAPDENTIYASSVRVQLPTQIRDLIASLGFGWSGITYRQAGLYYERNCRAQWTLIIAGQAGAALRTAVGKPTFKAADPLHWRYRAGHLELEVEHVADTYIETFYDLEVDYVDHSFTTAQCAISNSELCEYQDAEDIITGGLMRAVIDTPNTFGILESTALGIGNWWHKEWQKNKREADRGVARVRPVFLPWFVGTDLYPTAADMRKRPVPPDWSPSDRTIRHAERARAYVTTNTLLLKHLAKGNRDWQLPRHQMYWYELEYRAAKENKELHIFLGELPADDIEAFQIQQNPLIDQEILMTMQERTRQPLGVYTIVGPDIPPALVAPSRQFDYSKPTITISTRDCTPQFDHKYQLIPLLFEGYSSFDEQLKLLIWEWPTFPHVYGIGVDCSEGVGGDNAAIEVLREATPTREPGQVAEWVSNQVTAFQLWPLVLALGCLYSRTPDPRTNELTQCRLAIETWTNGAACQNELQKRGWFNFHPMFYAGDSKRPKQIASVNRIGMMTNAVLRSALQDLWMTHIKEEAIDLPSPFLVQEITTLENVEGKAQALLGFNDDRWMSLGFPLLSLHQAKRPDEQFQRKRVQYQPGLVQDQPIPHPTWQPSSQSSSEPFKPGRQATQPIFRDRSKGALAGYVNPNLPIRERGR